MYELHVRWYTCTVRLQCAFVAMCPATDFDVEKLNNITVTRNKPWFCYPMNSLFIIWITMRCILNNKWSIHERLGFTKARPPKEFENGVFTHQIFSVHTTRENYQNATIPVLVFFLLEETSRKSPIIVISAFRKASVHTKTVKNRACSNSYDLESVLEKLRFRDGLVWTVRQP